MKAYNVKKLSYRDKLAKRNRLFFILKFTGFFIALAFLAGGGGYLLFFTDKLEIKDITINGLEVFDRELVMAEISRQTEHKTLGHLPVKKNTVFFNVNSLEDELVSKYPMLKNVEVDKALPHGLVVNITERKPAGIWCVLEECRYFDTEMATWGSAARSSGFLLLTVEDRRPRDFGIDKDFFDAILEVTAGPVQPTIRSVVIPEDSFDEFHVYTDRSFYIIFSWGEDIRSQIEVLRIFLEEKGKDPGFAPEYLDLRIEGRVYYK